MACCGAIKSHVGSDGGPPGICRKPLIQGAQLPEREGFDIALSDPLASTQNEQRDATLELRTRSW